MLSYFFSAVAIYSMFIIDVVIIVILGITTHRPQSSSFLGFIFRIL